MEPISLAVGVVSLYNVSIDVLDHVRDYKEFGTESQTTLVCFEASKLKLKNWANGLGIRDGKLVDSHDPRLDDPKTASVIQNVLRQSTKIFGKLQDTRTSLRLPVQQLSTETDGWLLPVDDIRNEVEQRQSSSTRSRLAWATGGKAKLGKEVRNFEGLVNILNEVVPPRESEAGSMIKYMLPC